MNIVSTASDLIEDFKIGYMTLASPKFMFAKVIETAMGCIISLYVFWLFYHTFGTLGQLGSTYPAPFAIIYRNIAILGVDGVSAPPKNCCILVETRFDYFIAPFSLLLECSHLFA
ncbi:putative metal-nicotianamine transporter YSL7 [Trifolium repens]|nr:putative metal-nicotianamine transporter YSL7 [Trifolium repens]